MWNQCLGLIINCIMFIVQVSFFPKILVARWSVNWQLANLEKKHFSIKNVMPMFFHNWTSSSVQFIVSALESPLVFPLLPFKPFQCLYGGWDKRYGLLDLKQSVNQAINCMVDYAYDWSFQAFACQSTCMVISLESSIFQDSRSTEVFEDGGQHCHMPVWTSLSFLNIKAANFLWIIKITVCFSGFTVPQ